MIAKSSIDKYVVNAAKNHQALHILVFVNFAWNILRPIAKEAQITEPERSEIAKTGIKYLSSDFFVIRSP